MLSSVQNTLTEQLYTTRNTTMESQTWIIHKTLKISLYAWKKLVTFVEKFKLFHILQRIKNTEGYKITLLKLLAEIDWWILQGQYFFIKKIPTILTLAPTKKPKQLKKCQDIASVDSCLCQLAGLQMIFLKSNKRTTGCNCQG